MVSWTKLTIPRAMLLVLVRGAVRVRVASLTPANIITITVTII